MPTGELDTLVHLRLEMCYQKKKKKITPKINLITETLQKQPKIQVCKMSLLGLGVNTDPIFLLSFLF